MRLHLETLAGLREILGCMQLNVPLHGQSNEKDPGGISECRTLWLELHKNKHTASKANQSVEGKNAEEEQDVKDVDMMMGMDESGGSVIITDEGMLEEAAKPKDPLEQEACVEAQKHGSHIHRFNGKEGLQQLEHKLCLVLVLVHDFHFSRFHSNPTR